MITQDDFLKIERQLDQTNVKIDNLYKLVNLISNDLGVSHGLKMYETIDEMRNQVKTMSRELTPGEMKAISYRVDTIKKSLDSMQKREYY